MDREANIRKKKASEHFQTLFFFGNREWVLPIEHLQKQGSCSIAWSCANYMLPDTGWVNDER